MLETTLSIRNTDPGEPISLTAVKYYDTNGTLLKEYLNGEMTLAPLATAEFLVEQQDASGGSGANFIVVWDADEPVYEPLMEAVMIGIAGSTSISFTSAARVLADRQVHTGLAK
jgi:hypothetical protein